jgi:dolichyl-phosphate-mannose-protein mannosyltransferase/uncharacterized protein DUF1420
MDSSCEFSLLPPVSRFISRALWRLDSPVALILGVAHLLVVAALFLVAAAWGARLLERFGFETQSHLESVLLAAGVSFVVLEFALFLMAATGSLRRGPAILLLGLLALSAGRGWRLLWSHARSLARSCRASPHSLFDRAIFCGIALFLALEALLAMAPLTGSDAMHYHFTVPLLEQGRPLAPIFWLTHSFFTGQAHLLISLGLALGSDHISMGLIFLGGLLTAAALFAMARELMPLRWAWIAALIFVATPLVFWQIGTSGSPDIWMAFYVALAALAAARGEAAGASAAGSAKATHRWFVLAGLFAGAAAGVKYTGWVIPFVLLAYLLVVRRSWKTGAACALVSLVVGIWPLARNWMWTGDPVFPFLTPWLAPARVNLCGLEAIRLATRAEAFGRDLPHLLKFPFALVLNGNQYGLGHYFGPLVLAFAPLLPFANWRKPAGRFAALFWATLFVSALLTSQMGRFLLPAYALSLALVLSGVAAMKEGGRRIIHLSCAGTIAVFLLFAAASDAIYAREFLPVVLGIEQERAFLERMAPDYRIVEFINRNLAPEAGGQGNGSVMVFFRHLYYLRVPFVDGAPEYSWAMDPPQVQTPDAMLELLRNLDVRWIVQTREYPEDLARPLLALEQQGKLLPIASTDVENRTGTGRIYNQTEKLHVVLFRVTEGNEK